MRHLAWRGEYSSRGQVKGKVSCCCRQHTILGVEEMKYEKHTKEHVSCQVGKQKSPNLRNHCIPAKLRKGLGTTPTAKTTLRKI